MKARWIGVIGGLVLVGVLALVGAGVARAWGGNGGFGSWMMGQTTTTSPNGYGPGNMMGGYGPKGTYGPGNMMGGNGMMGGYGSAQTQNPSSAAPVTGDTVTMQNFAFQPANLQIKVGMTVTWTNQDTAPHTVTFRDSSLTSSKLLQKGESYSYTFAKAGTFSYYCQVHPNMIAQVVVTA